MQLLQIVVNLLADLVLAAARPTALTASPTPEPAACLGLSFWCYMPASSELETWRLKEDPNQPLHTFLYVLAILNFPSTFVS